METSYNDLIQKILQHPSLKNFVAKEAAEGDFLNLVHPEWFKRLENYCVYQRHANRVDGTLYHAPNIVGYCDVQVIRKNDDKLRLIVAFPCKISGNFESQKRYTFSVYSSNSEPLMMVARAMTRDLKETHKLVENFKFIADLCNFVTCVFCKNSKSSYQTLGYKIDEVSPCTRKTFMHDGKKVLPSLGPVIKSIFGNREYFVVTGLVEISMRCMYFRDSEKVVKVGGRIVKMLAIDPINLDPVEEDLFFSESLHNLNKCVEEIKNTSNKKSDRETGSRTISEHNSFPDINLNFSSAEEENLQILSKSNRKNDILDSIDESDIIPAIPESLVEKPNKKIKIQIEENSFKL